MVDTDRSKKKGARPESGEQGRAGLSRRTVFSLSPDETVELGRVLGRGLRGGELLLLEGDLGLGKTVLAKGIAEGLGVAPEDVTSPSFTLVQEYHGGRVPLFHVDLYRLESVEEMGTLGIEEILAGGGVILVEWGEKLPPYLRRDAVTLRLTDVGEGSRRIEIVPPGTERPTTLSDA